MVKPVPNSALTQKIVLIHSSYGLWPMLEYELDIVQRKLDDGYKVIFLTCQGDVQACEANKNANGEVRKRYCTECKSRVLSGLRWLKAEQNQLIVANQKKLSPDQKEIIESILNAVDANEGNEKVIRSIVNVGGVDIFESALSTIVTDLKISSPDLGKYAGKLKAQLSVGLENYYSALNHLKESAPSEVYVYNGRFAKYRSMLRLAKDIGIPVKVYEYPYLGYERYITIDNEYPHNIPNTAKLIKQVVLNSTHSEEEIVKLGAAWFNNRIFSRGQVEEPMIPTYNYWQKEGMIRDWDKDDYNIVFFVSSEHEVSAIQEVQRTLPYGQIKAVQTMLAATDHSVIHVRVHPNLQAKDPGFMGQITALGNEKRLNIIMPSSPIDSYELMKMADLVVTFGSTTGIEAAFLRKPVITVGTSFYEEFPATAKAYRHDELVQLVKSAENKDYSLFPPVEQRYSEACKFSYSFVNFGNKPIYVSRESYAGGLMQYRGISLQIKASRSIFFLNRLLDLPANLFEGGRLLMNSYKLRKFVRSPSRVLFQKLFSSNPSRTN